MKKKILIVIGVLSLFLFLFPESKVSASVNNKTQNLGEKTIEFSDKLSTEYESLQDLYRNTGLFWLAISIASFISIFCVLIHRKIDVLVPSTEIQSIFHDG